MWSGKRSIGPLGPSSKGCTCTPGCVNQALLRLIGLTYCPISSDWSSNQTESDPLGGNVLPGRVVSSRSAVTGGGATGSFPNGPVVGYHHLRIVRTLGTPPERDTPSPAWSPTAKTPPPLFMKVVSAASS